ncbi:MAG: peptidylprolyl isomerase [Alphaproteobacteria bacterium]
MTPKSLTSAIAISLAAMLTALSPESAVAQQSHGITAVVNDDIVTTHDLRQRVLFMMVTTGVERTEESLARVQSQALRNLVDEKIQLQESEKYDQKINPQDIDRSVARLIGRNGLDPQEVVERLAAAGISIDTLRGQVKSELAWQRIVNGLYGSRIRISDAQIDETLTRLSANASKPSYQVAEIYIEATPDIGGMDGAFKGAEAMIQQVKEGAPFPLLARQFSSAPTAAAGGELGWVREGELRPEIEKAILSMEKGSLSAPIQVPGGVYVVALLDVEVSESDTLYKLKQINVAAETPEEIEAAKLKIEEARAVVKSCDTIAADVQAVEGLKQADMGELRAKDMSDAILEKLATTDVGALSEPIETGSTLAAILVCDRNVVGSNIPTRDEVEDRLMDQQLAQASKRHLRDLRRKASIVVR